MPSPVTSYGLRLQVLPSPHGFDYSSPRAMAKSLVVNHLSRLCHAIGHMVLVLESRAADGTVTSSSFAMTTANDTEERTLVLRKGYAFGVLFHTFIGRFETKTEIASALAQRRRAGLVEEVRFALTPEQFARALHYVDNFVEAGAQARYGLTIDPHEGHGAGCSAFAVGALEACGLMDAPLAKAWRRFLAIPRALIGGPLTGQKVPFPKLFLSPAALAWADLLYDPHLSVHFWDPERIYAWVLDRKRALGVPSHAPLHLTRGLGSEWVRDRASEDPRENAIAPGHARDLVMPLPVAG